jgi:hypothetical protein
MQADAAADQAGQIFFLLRFGAEIPDGNFRTPHVRIDREQKSVVSASIAERFERADGRQRVGPAAAVFGRDGQALNAEVRAFLPKLFGKSLIVVARDDVVLQFFLGEPQYFFTKRRLLFTPCKVQGLSSPRFDLAQVPLSFVMPTQKRSMSLVLPVNSLPGKL